MFGLTNILTSSEVKEEIHSFCEQMMRKYEATNPEKVRIYEMFWDYINEYVEFPDVMDELYIDEFREDAWNDFCRINNVNSRTVKYEDGYPTDLDPDEREDYDEAMGDLMTKDWD